MGERIPLFPLHTLLLPSTDLGLHVFEERYRDLVADCLRDGLEFGVVLIKHGREVGGPAEPHGIGTAATIAGYARLPDGRYLLEVEGTRRFRILTESSNGSYRYSASHALHRPRPLTFVNERQQYPTAHVEWLGESIGNFADARARGLEVDQLFAAYRTCGGDGDLPVRLPADPVARSYVVASLMRIEALEKQKLLEIDAADQRLGAESDILRREIAVLDHLRAKRG